MKRIVLIGTAVAGLFTAGITTVATASTARTASQSVTKVKRETKVVRARLTCSLSLTTMAPAGSTDVTPLSSSGAQYGPTRCGGLVPGITRDVFATTDSGDIAGTIQHWFRGGVLSGTFSLTPDASNQPPTTTSFSTSSFTGTVKISGGQGLLRRTTGKGTLRCATTDGVHFACTEHLHLATTETVTVVTKAS